MNSQTRRLTLALVTALLLSILPLPQAWTALRPPWVLLLMLYVRFYLPGSFRVGVVMFAGLCLDVLLATVMGEHSFALLLATWLAGSKARRFGFFSTGQQVGFVGLLCLVYQGSNALVNALSGYHYSLLSVVGSALFGLIFWPWAKALADATLIKAPLQRIVY